MTITPAQYDALMEIADKGERFKANELNIRPQTVKAIATRGWVEIIDGNAFVTEKAWADIA